MLSKLSKSSISRTPSTSATQRAAVKSPAMSQGTGSGRVKKAVLISSIPPLFMKTEKNPDGVPKEVVDGIRDGTTNQCDLVRKSMIPLLI
jgi:hypothetical protein